VPETRNPSEAEGARSGAPATYWYFDESYGDHSAAYIPVDALTTADHWPSIPAKLTCDVVLSGSVGAVFRRVPKNWVATAGTYCQIVGRWSDGDVRVQLGLSDTTNPDRKLTIDGRFPNWVVETTSRRQVLASNIPAKRRWPRRLLVLMTVVLTVAAATAYAHNNAWVAAWCGTDPTFEITVAAATAQVRALAQQAQHTGSDAIALACRFVEH
jgi:hypothetical protein